ncbi:MAG: hypothetical protein B7X48_02045 [Acidiphilium sp. 34-60-192]|nr:MAG: hypothetical protein B7X48_02045 [Acidiphilium sp. 34-60-192]
MHLHIGMNHRHRLRIDGAIVEGIKIVPPAIGCAVPDPLPAASATPGNPPCKAKPNTIIEPAAIRAKSLRRIVVS